MDAQKIGSLIRKLRVEQKMTQRELAAMLQVSDKAISKWERGMGFPDLSLLPALSKQLRVDLESLLAGELDPNDTTGGNMKKSVFYVCPTCGNLITASSEASVACCGKRLEVCVPQKAAPEEKLSIELIDGELFISSDHPMTKEHYIAFVAVLTGDRMIVCRQYPEWDLQVRMQRIPHGTLLWYCTEHGLRFQYF
ncbi:MAG: helix-turn-helix domain-containing protein [Oscillospiraceae bacterium]|nr:helix-turn-helix domain-containing protein [Oscillospiraceae bacterium]